MTALDEGANASLVDALLVYAEPLASGAHVVVIGDSGSVIAERLLDLGARGVHVFDPDVARANDAAHHAARGVTVRIWDGELDVRDGAFDLAIVTDLALLDDVTAAVARLGRAVRSGGAVVAMGRARVASEEEGAEPFASELGPATLEYGELYDAFASEFEAVTLAGVLPFQGIVFAQLGNEDEAPSVSVDSRLAPPDAPSVFVVVASRTDARGLAPRELDPYAIVQVTETPAGGGELELAYAAASVKVDLLSIELDRAEKQLAAAADVVSHLDRAVAERDVALTRAMELEAVLAASQQAMATLERRLLEAERGCLERDDRIAALSAELDVRRSAETDDTRAAETAAFEAQLAERARFVASLEKELVRREQLVKELVTQLEEAREGREPGPVFEAAAPLSPPKARPDAALVEEVTLLRSKLDALASEVARREGELTARAWRITELENERDRRRPGAAGADEGTALRRALDEIDALRQALAQEHEARVAAESGEELTRARSELARQAALLEQVRGRAESA